MDSSSTSYFRGSRSTKSKGEVSLFGEVNQERYYSLKL